MSDTTNRFPPGRDEERVRAVIEHYEGQTDDELATEIEAAFEDSSQTVMVIPKDLVPAVRAPFPNPPIPRQHPRRFDAGGVFCRPSPLSRTGAGARLSWLDARPVRRSPSRSTPVAAPPTRKFAVQYV